MDRSKKLLPPMPYADALALVDAMTAALALPDKPTQNGQISHSMRRDAIESLRLLLPDEATDAE